MTYALVVAGWPQDRLGSNEEVAWKSFVPDAVARTARVPSVERLNQGTWLFPLDSALTIFGEFVSLAASENVPLRVLFLDQSPALVTA